MWSIRRLYKEVDRITPAVRDMKLGVQQGSVLSPTLFSLCINDRRRTPGVYLGPFANNTCIYVTDRKGFMFSESCSAVSVLWRRCVSAGTCCGVLPVNASNNLWVADFISPFIGCTRRNYTFTLPILYHINESLLLV
jgi:hypothetical protein